MPALKVLVVAMGVLIVAGLAVIGVTLVKRIGGGSAAPLTGASAPALSAAGLAIGGLGGAQFGDKNIELPRNGRLVGVHTEAGRLILRVLLPGNRETLIVLDLATGERLGTVTVQPAP